MVESAEEITVSTPGIILASFIEIFLPLISSFIWIKNFNGKAGHILIGVSGFILSVGIESVFLTIVSKIVGKDSNVFYTIAAICPGLFEETGKYICIKYIYSKEKTKNISVSYGIGHGGIESIIVGMSLFVNIFAKDTLIQNGVLKESVTFLVALMSVVERLFAFILQISLSVVNYKAVRDQIIKFYIFAIIIHDVIDLLPLIKLKGILTSIYVIELIVCIYSSCISWFAYNIYRNFEEKSEEKIIPLEDKKDSSINNN